MISREKAQKTQKPEGGDYLVCPFAILAPLRGHSIFPFDPVRFVHSMSRPGVGTGPTICRPGP
jgi:hypothetical protein